MMASKLRVLIAAGESLDVEFKGEERRPFSDHDLVEVVVCMANRSEFRSGQTNSIRYGEEGGLDSEGKKARRVL